MEPHSLATLLSIPVVLLVGLLIFVVAELGMTLNHHNSCVATTESVCYQDWVCAGEKGTTPISDSLIKAKKAEKDKDCFTNPGAIGCKCVEPDLLPDGIHYATIKTDLGAGGATIPTNYPDGTPATGGTLENYGFCDGDVPKE